MSYKLNEGLFSIGDFDKQKCFSSFLPGIAGKNGTPMWVFYVNRGQGIASFGIENKDRAIMEFKPADQSYSATTLKGFRTFLKINGEYFEAFSATAKEGSVQREMIIDKNTLSISEINTNQGVEVKVSYFTLPNENFSALVRTVEIKNIGSKEINIEVVDGLPELLPFGISNNLYKDMGFTARAWMEVSNIENDIPFYGVRTSVGDTEIVEEIKSSYFYFASDDKGLLKTVYDRNVLFGVETSLQEASEFKNGDLEQIKSKTQYTENILPSAFGMGQKKLETNETYRINSMIGFAENSDFINEKVKAIMNNDYIDTKKREAIEIVEDITKNIITKTSNKAFDSYCEQNYLDNILRGGYPLIFKNKDKKVVYHIFSRKHGDLERDYNFFSLQPSKYSQGNGNFRDVLQNRRNDIFFNPEVEEFNIKMFMNFIQADGNNPLVIKGTTFRLDKVEDTILNFVVNSKDKLKTYLEKREFTPGEVLSFIDKENIELNVPEDKFVEELMYHSKQYEQAQFGEGYWIDHWTYLMDLVDSFGEIYPDKMDSMLFEAKSSKIFDCDAFVKSRKNKYKFYKDKVMQIAAVEESKEKEKAIKKRGHNYLVNSEEKIYETDIFSKLLLLGVTKFSTLDPYGMGLEMESNKPGWNDALNGLPGMIGSGMGETFELKRLLSFVKESLENNNNDKITIFEELGDFIEKLSQLLDRYNEDKNQFKYWDTVASEKEAYRERVFYSISGNEKIYYKEAVLEMLDKALAKLEEGIEKSKEYGKGLYPTYFTYELTKYVKENETIIPKEFKVRVLPHFLEGPTRAFKTVGESEKKELYKFIKNSNIYDKKLKMYKTSESIQNEPNDIGRLRAFTPGWLENESIFMHMEFKYLLEILRAGLNEEFYEDIKTIMPPYLDYQTYGRSIIENSSFIVSSANRNETLHGQGFSARLSGSTAEFLSMWKYMFVGKKLFQMDKDELSFTFEPQLDGAFFDENGEIQFKLFSIIDVKYINKDKKSTFGNNKAVVKKIEITKGDRTEMVDGNVLTGAFAKELRNKELSQIICYFE